MLSLFSRSAERMEKDKKSLHHHNEDLSHFYEDVDEMGAATSRDGFIQSYPQRRMTTGEAELNLEREKKNKNKNGNRENQENGENRGNDRKKTRKPRTGSIPPAVQLMRVQKTCDEVPTPYQIRQMMKQFEKVNEKDLNSSENEEMTDTLQSKLKDIEESIHQVERRLSFNTQLTIPMCKQAQIHYKKRASTLTENLENNLIINSNNSNNSSQETSPKSDRAKFFKKKAEHLSNSQITLSSEGSNSSKQKVSIQERKRALTAQLSSSSDDSGIDRRLSLDGENEENHGKQKTRKKESKQQKTKSIVKKFTTRARSRSLGFLFGEKPTPPRFSTSYLNREWEIVTVKEMCRRLSLDEIDHIEMPIPEGAETSQILDELMIRQVMEILPARAEGYPWVQIYNSEKHGFSLATLYRKMAEFDEDMSPVLLIIRDTNEHVFGAIVSSAIRPHEGYWGTGDSCLLWRFTGEVPHTRELRHFTWTGDNQFFVNATKESLSIGAGGGHQGLWLDADLNHGRSQKCETFDNEPLAGDKEDFIIQFCEAFGFRM